MTEKTRSAKNLIDEALSRVPDNNYDAAEMLGVSEATVRRWREVGAPTLLRAETRRVLEGFLGKGEAEPKAGGGAEPFRAWQTAEDAAKLRAQALADLAAALKLEAKAADERAVSIGGHTRAIEREAESAATRATTLRRPAPGFVFSELTEDEREALELYRRDQERNGGGREEPPSPPPSPREDRPRRRAE